MTTTTTETPASAMIRTKIVEAQLGLPAGELTRDLNESQDYSPTYQLRIARDWAGYPTIKESSAAKLRADMAATLEANRARKRAVNADHDRDEHLFEGNQERQFFTALAAVTEHGGRYGDRQAPGVAYGVISSPDPEAALRSVITEYGSPSEQAIMYVMGRTRETSATGRAKGRPSWLG